MARFVFVIINHALAFVAVDPALTKAASWPVQAKPASFAVGSEGHLPALNGGAGSLAELRSVLLLPRRVELLKKFTLSNKLEVGQR